MTQKEIYKDALNDILNSKSTDVAVLRKIALKAFTQPIKDIADLKPMNWMQYESQQWEWFLIVNEVHVACLSNEEMDGKKWTLRDYDTDFAPVFGDGSMPEFDSLEEGKHYCEMKFLMWLKDSSQLLNQPETPPAQKDEGRESKDFAQFIIDEGYEWSAVHIGKWFNPPGEFISTEELYNLFKSKS